MNLEELTRGNSYEAGVEVCPGCENHCTVKTFRFANGKTFYSGNQCERVYSSSAEKRNRGVNMFVEKNRMLWRRATKPDNGTGLRIGIPRGLGIWEDFPFWCTLLTECGIEVVLSKGSSNSLYEKGIRTIVADNICFPANLLFMPSFSMAKKITDISGRGVGLDVVKSGIEALGGDVETRTKLGEGTTFTVRLPLTLAIIQALMVEIRDEKYAIALGSISNIENIPVTDIKYVQAQEVIHLRGSVIPLVRLDKVLDIEPQDDPENLTVVIVKRGDSQAGLVVDNLIGQQEIVIKSLGKYINGNKLISGATILGDGEIAMIIDTNTLI